VFEYYPQPSAAHVVRSETLTGLATRAQLSVTGTIGPHALHHLVMLPHLSFSIRVRQVDAHYQTSYCLGGARTRCQTDLAPLSMRGPADTKKWGRGSRDNLSGRGRWRGAGGVLLDKQSETSPTYSGQIICGAAVTGSEPTQGRPGYRLDWISAGKLDPKDPNFDSSLVKKLKELKPLFAEDGQVVLWACDVAKGPDGIRFMQMLADLWDVPIVGPNVGTDVIIFKPWKGGEWITVHPGMP
jgi:hypothetical protein